jgi:hypothetical protein
VVESRCRGQAEESRRALWDEMARARSGAYKAVELLRRGEEILDPVELRELGDAREKTMLHAQPRRDRRFGVGTSWRCRDGLRLLGPGHRLRGGPAAASWVFRLLNSHPVVNEIEERRSGELAWARRSLHPTEPMVYTLGETDERRSPAKMGRSCAGS